MSHNPESPPDPWVRSGGETPEESRAAEVVRQAVVGPEQLVHPAVGARIKSSISDRLRGERPVPRRWPRLVIAGATALTVAAVLLAVWPASDFRVLKGTLTIGAAGDPMPRAAGSSLPADSIATTIAEPAMLGIGSRVRATLEPATRLHLVGRSEVELLAGTTFFDVDSLSAGETFVVKVGEATVQVIGTSFVVKRTRQVKASVRVLEGTVQVRHQGGVTYLTAGMVWPSGTRRATRGEESSLSSTERVATGERAAGGTFVESQSPPGTAAGDPLSACEPTGQQASEPESSPLDDALGLIEAGDIAGARRTYRTLADTSQPVAEIALYLLARLEAQRFDDHEAALVVLEEMQERFPSGALSLERHLSRIEALYALERCELAIRARAELSSAYPRSTSGLDHVDTSACASEEAHE